MSCSLGAGIDDKSTPLPDFDAAAVVFFGNLVLPSVVSPPFFDELASVDLDLEVDRRVEFSDDNRFDKPPRFTDRDLDLELRCRLLLRDLERLEDRLLDRE